MRIQTEEWRRFIPGIRMYRGKKTFFYNGEILWEGDLFWYHRGHTLIYDKEERKSWEVVIVLPGVEVIPESTFFECRKLKTIILSDTVRRIEDSAFNCCMKLESIKLSRNLEFIGRLAFRWCEFLTSIFIPPSCSEIGDEAFLYCTRLLIIHVPLQTRLGNCVIFGTALIQTINQLVDNDILNNWIRNINRAEEYALHRACSSFNPLEEIIHAIVKRQGLQSLKKRNFIRLTPMQYLEANPYTDIEEKKIMKRYILDMMGEIV
ncbi:leucine-rich repeat domain-containing protein [Chaetoceros tenuissimus]|uniref:Leucine-rich repeat domain-containing protein n=1 Tax=Chaetoceros tenuissimus TaxID=426638 RepID=A0AAD3CGG4_9STRA|nr:leucine-rich repeat domain-containing protein [Chaetoceros tenuissimus]